MPRFGAFPAPESGEGHIIINPNAYQSIIQGTWVLTINTALHFNGAFWNSSGAQNDGVSYQVYLAAGTYTLMIEHSRATDYGIAHVTIDTTEVGTIDMYADPADTNNRATITGISIASSGLKTLKFEAKSKNASSSAYTISMYILCLWRTA